ncbi:Aste57867_25003 [Aphanomyces stellatus]|uniref:Aste57867_25003 protein n=1 Tax=Aphanomyces stellatus TaxID=120398 RepID=A0A485LSV6_9STRA|nr:hypothetical protein As57867_024925 [Aphanomyces stellatus]VFU01634.1 Aste57867_25003 [Aphanomyces stellatus]
MRATAAAALINHDLLCTMTQFQPGVAPHLRPFLRFISDHYIHCGLHPRHSSVRPSSLLPRDYAFLVVHLEAFGAIFSPWLHVHGVHALPRLLALDERLHEITVYFAIRDQVMPLVQYLHATHRLQTTERPTTIAAWMGSLSVVEYLHRYDDDDDASSSSFTASTMDIAARRGHLDVVAFLHRHRSEGCSTHAMDAAAWHGHLQVVQFLHHHRTEGATTLAMDEAAANGHLQVVQFLHTHRTEGCTARAMTRAAAHGHLEVVRFLLDHRPKDMLALRAADYSHRDRVIACLCEGHSVKVGPSDVRTASRHVDSACFVEEPQEHYIEGEMSWEDQLAELHVWSSGWSRTTAPR